jgi:HSP20 family molecular chaperone IbpA
MPTPWDPWRRDNRSLSVGQPSRYMTPLTSLLPEVMREFDDINRSLLTHARLESGENGSVRAVFDDLGTYEKLNVDVDPDTNMLTVKGEHQTEHHHASIQRAILLPCGVAKPDMITAEVQDGRVIVIVPKEAQKMITAAPTPKAIKVNVIKEGAKQVELSKPDATSP